MSKKLIGVVAAIAAVGGTALATAAVVDGGDGPRPDYATVTVDLGASGERAAKPKGGIGPKKPKLIYLQSATPVSINPADATAGGVGPYVDVKLTGCSKVVDGGVVPSSVDVFVQGSYVAAPGEYHVLIGLDDGALAARTPFTITSSLTCLKGAK
jgi:hypothetical protein